MDRWERFFRSWRRTIQLFEKYCDVMKQISNDDLAAFPLIDKKFFGYIIYRIVTDTIKM